jgi:hypothetical protein
LFKIISQNDYFLSNPLLPQQSTLFLSSLRDSSEQKSLLLETSLTITEINSEYHISVMLKNDPNAPIAFFIRLQYVLWGHDNLLMTDDD